MADSLVTPWPFMSHLILQSPDLVSANIEKIAALVEADGVQHLGTAGPTTAVRLLGANPDEQPAVHALCEQWRMDYAFLEDIQRLRDCRILAMDMDSTLISIECIDEIADAVGRKAEVAAITEAAMRGEITDFTDSLRRRVALLEGVPESALESVYTERLRLNPSAEKLVAGARRCGLTCLLVSCGFAFFTERLRSRLQLDHVHASTLEVVNGRLTGQVLGDIVDGAVKARHLQILAESLDAAPEQIIAVGDGANDLPMLAHAYYSVAYRAKPVVREQARFALNVSPLDGILNWFRLSF